MARHGRRGRRGVDWAGSGWPSDGPDGPPDFSAVLPKPAGWPPNRRASRRRGDAAPGRRAVLGLSRRGRISAGGATRLLATPTGGARSRCPRADDVAALPALLEVDAVTGDPWTALSRWAATRSADDVIARAQLLDIAAAALGEAPAGLPAVRGVR